MSTIMCTRASIPRESRSCTTRLHSAMWGNSTAYNHTDGVLGTHTRSAALPDVPTIADAADVPGFEAVSWYALMAPAGTPQAIVAKLHDGAVEAINAPDAKAGLEAQGAMPVGSTPAELATVIATETARWAKVIRDANIKIAP